MLKQNFDENYNCKLITSFEIPNANKVAQSIGHLGQPSNAAPSFLLSAKCSSWVNRLTFLDAICTFDSNPWGKAPFGA